MAQREDVPAGMFRVSLPVLPVIVLPVSCPAGLLVIEPSGQDSKDRRTGTISPEKILSWITQGSVRCRAVGLRSCPPRRRSFDELHASAQALLLLRLVIGVGYLCLDATPGIDLDATLDSTLPYGFGVNTTRAGLAGRSGLPAAADTGYLTAGVGESFQDFAQFIGVTIIQINLIFGAVESKIYCLVRFRAINIVFKQHSTTVFLAMKKGYQL